MIVLNKEINKHSKEELATMLGKLEMESHKRKDVMVNRVRYALHNGAEIETQFDEPQYDAELEAKHQPKEKAAKPTIAFEWIESPYAGRQVYGSFGTGKVVSETPKGFEPEAYFLIETANGEKPYKEKSVRFNAVDDRARENMVIDNAIRTESGSPSIHSKNEIAYALKGSNSAEIKAVYYENGLGDLYEKKVEGGRNKGMLRMDLGNILAGRFRRGEHVVINGVADMGVAAQNGQRRAEEIARVQAEAKEAAAKARAEAAEEAKIKKAEKLKAAEEAKAAKAAEAAAKAEAKKAEKPAKEKAVKATKAKKEKKAA